LDNTETPLRGEVRYDYAFDKLRRLTQEVKRGTGGGTPLHELVHHCDEFWRFSGWWFNKREEPAYRAQGACFGTGPYAEEYPPVDLM